MEDSVNYTRVKEYTKALLKSVAQTSFAVSKNAITRETAKSMQESAAKKIVRKLGIGVVFELVLPAYLKSIYETSTSDRKITIVKSQGKEEESRETIALYTYGVDNFFRSRWPDAWKAVREAEEKRRRNARKNV